MLKYAGVGILLAVAGLGCGGPAAEDAGAEDAAMVDAPRIGADASTDGAARPDAVVAEDAPSMMDAPTIDPDAATLDDAAMPGDDAPASDDAFVAADAAVLADAAALADAFMAPDAFVPIDAFTTPDAFVALDAFTPPDAFVPRDAFVAPDAPAVACSTPAMGFALGIFPSGAATAGATISYVGCSATTTAAGVPATWMMNVSPVASYFRLTRAGFRTTNSAEINPVVIMAGANLQLQIVGTSLAPYDATRAHLLVSIGTAMAPCTKSGNTVSLPGHPEATVTYINAAGASLGGTTTGMDGLAWITGIVPAAGEIATPVLTSGMAGCTRRPTFDTGRVALIVDTVTVLNAEMRP